MTTMPTDVNRHKSITQIRPHVQKGTHPIETGRYLLATRQISEFLERLDIWIEYRALGAIVHGNPRIGKTQAIGYATRYVREKYPALPVFQHICKAHKTPNEDVFYTELLNSVGHKFQKQGKAWDKRERISKFLITEAAGKETNRVLFFMDDAQLMQDMHYKWWMDVQNTLSKEGIILTTILVGQEELIQFRTILLDANQYQIVGRFMTNSHPFRGLETLIDVKECLKGYDEESEYPEGSGYSLTRYYFPETYSSHGFRLQNSANEVVSAIKQIRTHNGLYKKFELPMLFMTLATEYCLKRFGVDGGNLNKLTVKHWMEAFINVGYSDFVSKLKKGFPVQ